MASIPRRSFLAAASGAALFGQPRREPFKWPEGKRCAVSLTFDDARPSQLDNGLALFKRTGAKATFYLSPGRMEQHIEGWKQAVKDGHEMGNHSDTHPCTANYRLNGPHSLEDLTLDAMGKDLDACTNRIQAALGVTPVSFAYPCGQKFVGRGAQARSYVPLVAERFLTGRGYLDERANDPAVCDLAALMGTGFDDIPYEAMLAEIEKAKKESRWLVFVGHDIGPRKFQCADAEALERLCRHALDPANGIWLDTVATIARHLRKGDR